MIVAGGYLLVAAPHQIDAERFSVLVADARHALTDADPAGASALLGSALDLWRGEALADLAHEPFARDEIARLEEARLSALEDRIDADLMIGDHRGLVGELEALVGLHPHRERLLELMLALTDADVRPMGLTRIAEAARHWTKSSGWSPDRSYERLSSGSSPTTPRSTRRPSVHVD